ncbi:MAG: hypothetical protein AAF488_17795 [Planctomycetota bacterium]
MTQSRGAQSFDDARSALEQDLIEQTRATFEAARPPYRGVRGFFAWRKLRAVEPRWMRGTPDRLLEIYRNQRALIERGQVVWGCIVQANVLLYEPGPDDCPAAVIYSPDPEMDGRLRLFRSISESLYRLKGSEPSSRSLQRFAETLTDEHERLMKLPVPRRLTHGTEVIYTSIMVPRKHVPGGYLAQSYFPLLVAPEITEATMILPVDFWAPGLIEAWTAEE